MLVFRSDPASGFLGGPDPDLNPVYFRGLDPDPSNIDHDPQLCLGKP